MTFIQGNKENEEGKKVLGIYLIVVGIAAHVFILWMGLGWPFFFDRWLGLPQEAVVVDPFPGRTAEHPANILKIEEAGLDVEMGTPLNIVTSPIHSRRTALCFRKKGFSNFRMVTRYVGRNIKDPEIVRELKESIFEAYRPSGKRYDDFLFRLRLRTNYFLTAARELVAIGWYKIKGYI